MLIVDKIIISGVRFVLDKLMQSVEAELNDDSRLREELLAAQMRVELGEMTQQEFDALQDEVMLRIREIRERRGEVVGAIDISSDKQNQGLEASNITGVTADFVADDFHENDDGTPRK